MHTLAHRLRIFAHEHDDVPAFHAAYLVGTFLVAAVFSLGYFALLIACHMCLDYVKYRDYFHFGFAMTVKAMLLESIVDLALFFVSLTFAIYLSHDLALSMVSGLFRSGLTILQAFVTLLPKIQILEHLFSVCLNVHTYLYTPHAGIRRPFSLLHRVALASIGVTSVLLLGSIAVFHGHEQELLSVFSRTLSLKL